MTRYLHLTGKENLASAEKQQNRKPLISVWTNCSKIKTLEQWLKKTNKYIVLVSSKSEQILTTDQEKHNCNIV